MLPRWETSNVYSLNREAADMGCETSDRRTSLYLSPSVINNLWTNYPNLVDQDPKPANKNMQSPWPSSEGAPKAGRHQFQFWNEGALDDYQ